MLRADRSNANNLSSDRVEHLAVNEKLMAHAGALQRFGGRCKEHMTDSKFNTKSRVLESNIGS